jgi:hypothetical protein
MPAPRFDASPPFRMDAGVRMDSGDSSSTPRKMSNILRSYRRLPISDRIAYMRQSTDKQKATPSPIAHPYSNLTVLDTKVGAAEEIDNQITGLENQIKVLRAQRIPATDVALEEFEHDVDHIQSDSKGEAAQIIACGLDVPGPRAAVGPMTQPLELVLSMSSFAGGIDWHHHPVEGAVTTEVQSTATPTDQASWVDHEPSTGSSGTITGLPSGTRRYVRTRARGPLGPGPWSDEASKMVP